MRLPMIAGNWNMSIQVNVAVEWAQAVRKGITGANDVEVVLCLPTVSLPAVKTALEGSSIKLGAQFVRDEEDSAHTDETTPAMLTELCEYLILGQSHQRHLFGDRGDVYGVVNKRMAALSGTALQPILCVGETIEEKEAGSTDEVLSRQLTSALDGVNCAGSLTVAYEPILAMGTGIQIHGKQANDAAHLIRSTLANLCGKEAAESTRVLYGGDATPDNMSEFIEQSEIDGALVSKGGLEPEPFTDIVHLAQYVYFPDNPPIKDLIPW